MLYSSMSNYDGIILQILQWKDILNQLLKTSFGHLLRLFYALL
jgi:hypothetical protein